MKEALKKYRLDVIVIAAILVVALSVLLIVTLSRKPGSYAKVYIDNEVVAEYPLSVNGSYELNGGTNVLTIENGKAYISYAECKTHQCEAMGKIHWINEYIECQHNGIKIIITGEITESTPDIIS